MKNIYAFALPRKRSESLRTRTYTLFLNARRRMDKQQSVAFLANFAQSIDNASQPSRKQKPHLIQIKAEKEGAR
ncbi:unnamed protein product [Ceratitis capitata]|uniref:(Mediterranean fruit fly) hypothetical protein n=1 Tax=Ceratitis capitata TaxID=7213 RepID=A0A811V295_CERCA|nr:unnamed protein product [Ceratitis capitata]